MQKVSIALAILASAAALTAQNCNGAPPTLSGATFNPFVASFYYPSSNGNTLNQYIDVTATAPLDVQTLYTCSYDQAAGSTTPPNQVGNVAEVRIYTFPVSHTGNEGSMTGWTHVATGEMTIVAWSGQCPTTNWKDPVTGLPAPFILPVGTYGLCIEYIPTTWSGTAALPQTNVPLLNPGSLSCLGYDPSGNNQPYPAILYQDQFLTLNTGAIQQTGAWQTVDATGTLVPNTAISGVITDQPNIALDYVPDAAAAITTTFGAGCYNKPFMLYEQIPANTTPIDIAGTSYTAALTPSANGGFYTISQGGIPYMAPPSGAINLTLGGTAPTPIANSSANLDDCTFSYTPTIPITLPNPNGGLVATELGINSNGKIYFDTVAPSATSYDYNGANYGGITSFRDLATQWALFNTDLDPMVGGDIYVMEPSPNLGGVMIWFDNVPNWPAVPGVTNSMSIEFAPGGAFLNIAYGPNPACDGAANDAIVGFSAGNGQVVGGLIDWSAIPGAPNATLSGDGSSEPTLVTSDRPVAGSTIDIVLGNLPPAAGPGVPRVGLFSFSIAPSPAPIDLSPYGATSCNYLLALNPTPVNVIGLEQPLVTPDEIRFSWTVPGATFNQTQLFVQAGALHQVTPPNPAGVTVSSALCMKVGN